MSIQRAQRAAGEIKKELSRIIHTEMKDPRLGFLSLTDVELSPDLRYAKVFVSIMGTEREQTLTMEILERAMGFLRSELGSRIRLRYTPELSFHLDNSIEQGAKIEKLLRELENDK
jgi:ribosome-binding factor A